MSWLRQSTSVTVIIGPFLDATTGVDEETGLTPGVELSKAGGAFASANDGTVSHDAEGWYTCDLDETDTNTLGRLVLKAQDSANHLPVWHEFEVVPVNVWDSYFSTDKLQVDVRELGDSTLALTTQMKTDVNAEADTALTDYDPPTKAEMDTAHALLATEAKQDIIDTNIDAILVDTGTDGVVVASHSTAAKAEIQSECGDALDSYDPPTKTEMDTAHALLATEAKQDIIDTNVDAILSDTGTDGVAISTVVAQAIADEILKRDVSSVEDAAGTHSLTTIILAALESALSSTTWTIKKTGGGTFITKTVTLDSGATPITAVT